MLAAATRILHQGLKVQELTNGQTVEVEVTTQNVGTLDAEQVAVRVGAGQSGVVVQRDRAEIGPLRAGAGGVPQRFELTIPRGFVQDRLPLTVELSQRGFASQIERLDLPVKVQRPVLAPQFTIIGRHGGRAIEQNETADLEVRLPNAGGLMAQDVQARIEVTAPGVEIQGPKAVGVGTIPPNGQGVARFKLRLLRSVPAGELPVALTVTQADFPAVSDTLRVDVRQEQVKETRVDVPTPPPSRPPRSQRPILTLGSPRDGQVVQGERIELVGKVVDEKRIDVVKVEVNGKPVPEETVRQGLRRQLSGQGSARDQADLTVPLSLERGPNTIKVTAYNAENEQDQVILTVTRLEDQPQASSAQPSLERLADVDRHILDLGTSRADRRRWAVIIGIEQYRKAPPVIFARRDAYAMREYAIKG